MSKRETNNDKLHIAASKAENMPSNTIETEPLSKPNAIPRLAISKVQNMERFNTCGSSGIVFCISGGKFGNKLNSDLMSGIVNAECPYFASLAGCREMNFLFRR